MKKFDPARRPHRVMAIAAKRFASYRPIRTYYTAEDVGTVDSEGVYMGGMGDRYRLGDLMRRTVRAAMINRTRYTKEQRRRTIEIARELREKATKAISAA